MSNKDEEESIVKFQERLLIPDDKTFQLQRRLAMCSYIRAMLRFPSFKVILEPSSNSTRADCRVIEWWKEEYCTSMSQGGEEKRREGERRMGGG